jgi:3-deoxy-D-manno-octulosonic-acid transferase
VFKQKYKQSIPARFFLFKNLPLKKCDVWFHSCSLGETKAVMPLAKRFDNFGFSVITGTGFNEAKQNCENTRFLPYEVFLPFWTRPAKLLVVMEAELWLLLFTCAKMRGAKTALINARISDRSYPKYKKFSFFYKTLFYFVDVVFAQSEADKERLESLGAKNVRVSGNIKQFVGGYEMNDIKTDERRNFVAASTHEGEEAAIVDAFQDAGLFKKERLVVVPRHPERFEGVFGYLSAFATQNSLTLSRFGEDGSMLADIVLVDKIGELINIYAKSYLVVLGGAFAEIGGHNPLEPAYFGTKLISGTHIFNQQASFGKVKNAYFCVASELASLLKNHENLVRSEIFELEDAIGDTEKGLRELLKRQG